MQCGIFFFLFFLEGLHLLFTSLGQHMANQKSNQIYKCCCVSFCAEQDNLGPFNIQRGAFPTFSGRTSGKHHQRCRSDGRLLVHTWRPPWTHRGRVQRCSTGSPGLVERVHEQCEFPFLIIWCTCCSLGSSTPVGHTDNRSTLAAGSLFHSFLSVVFESINSSTDKGTKARLLCWHHETIILV